MDGHELAEVVGALGIFAFITTVISVIIVQVGATARAKAALAREDEYRKLAEAGAVAQQSADLRLAEIGDRLTGMEARLDSFERILKTVD
ncbi:hypothetical protein ACFVH6_04660 [Spirillospora sp. NPDC127200]